MLFSPENLPPPLPSIAREPQDFSTPGEGFNVLPCPARLPHDLQVGQKLARWFGEGYNKWYVGKITEVNRRRTKQENVSVVWSLRKRITAATTWGHFLASADDYGADRLWVVLEPIPILLDTESSSAPPSLPPSP